jgi:hypothetical protein
MDSDGVDAWEPLADRWKVVSLTAKEELVKNPLGTLQNSIVIS